MINLCRAVFGFLVYFLMALPITFAQSPLLSSVPSKGGSSDLRQSSYYLMTAENKTMQDDPNLNPAMFWLLDGETAWKQKQGKANQSCAGCHGEVSQSMRGVAAQFPKIVAGRLLNLEGQINRCRSERQGAEPFAYESKPLLDLSVLIASQSRGMPIAPNTAISSAALAQQLNQGRALYFKRTGQLNLSCAQCHDERAGLKLGGTVIPQAHPTGYPIYRLEWQAVGSLQRRLRNCMIGVRAEPYAFGAPELTQIELYLMSRAKGMNLETPGVRP
jgi:sulfur-oxidizing protein SoxA